MWIFRCVSGSLLHCLPLHMLWVLLSSRSLLPGLRCSIRCFSRSLLLRSQHLHRSFSSRIRNDCRLCNKWFGLPSHSISCGSLILSPFLFLKSLNYKGILHRKDRKNSSNVSRWHYRADKWRGYCGLQGSGSRKKGTRDEEVSARCNGTAGRWGGDRI